MEKKLEECVLKKNVLRCKKCEKEFESPNDLRMHVNEHKIEKDTFKCNLCGRSFNEEWKLNAHDKSHHQHSCDICDKKFKYENLKMKHIKITHENTKLYCHFFNNSNVCPNKEECVFLHEESGPCKYKGLCERKYCMYKHVYDAAEENVDNYDKDSDEKDKDDINDDDNEDYDEKNKTFFNPSQSEDSDSSTNTDETIKCGMCDFKYIRITDLKRHKERIHSWCSFCYLTFDSQETLETHKKSVHSDN